MNIAQFIHVLREERQDNFAAIQHMAQVLVNNQQQGRDDNGRSTLSGFMRNLPQTFIKTAEPLDADEWIRTIKDLFTFVNCNEDHEKILYASHYLGGTTRAWWDGFEVMKGGCMIT
ncbi:hypothetical protein D1007_52092 [Hordeum vulgare]|nr:hypothetical protein D1007_52092 [Hordeum vulgare]